MDGEEESSELLTTGSIRFFSNGYKIRYRETQEGFDGCFITLSVEGENKVVMSRSGAIASEMIMELSKKHLCVYSRPEGSFSMGVYTKKISSQMAESGGKLTFVYSLDINGNYLSENFLEVTISPLSEKENIL